MSEFVMTGALLAIFGQFGKFPAITFDHSGINLKQTYYIFHYFRQIFSLRVQLHILRTMSDFLCFENWIKYFSNLLNNWIRGLLRQSTNNCWQKCDSHVWYNFTWLHRLSSKILSSGIYCQTHVFRTTCLQRNIVYEMYCYWLLCHTKISFPIFHHWASIIFL